jgi:hypothetical protein
MLSPSAAHPVPVPRMVSRLVSVAAEHQVVPAALLTAPVIAAIIVNELYCDIAEANAVGNVFSPWLFSKAAAAVSCNGVKMLVAILTNPYIFTAAGSSMSAGVWITGYIDRAPACFDTSNTTSGHWNMYRI